MIIYFLKIWQWGFQRFDNMYFDLKNYFFHRKRSTFEENAFCIWLHIWNIFHIQDRHLCIFPVLLLILIRMALQYIINLTWIGSFHSIFNNRNQFIDFGRIIGIASFNPFLLPNRDFEAKQNFWCQTKIYTFKNILAVKTAFSEQTIFFSKLSRIKNMLTTSVYLKPR